MTMIGSADQRDLSQTPIVVFACGGGSFIEYETIVRSLNAEVCAHNFTAFST